MTYLLISEGKTNNFWQPLKEELEELKRLKIFDSFKRAVWTIEQPSYGNDSISQLLLFLLLIII